MSNIESTQPGSTGELTPPTPPDLPARNSGHRQDIQLLVFYFICILGLLIRGVYSSVTGILNYDPKYAASLASSILEALAMLFCVFLFLPPLIDTLKHIKGQAIPPAKVHPVKFWQVSVLGVLWVMVIALGAWITNLFNFGWAVTSPLFILGIVLPVFIFLWIGTGGLPIGSQRRLWSVLGYGMVGGTLAAAALEYLVVGIAALGLGLLAISNPQLLTFFNNVKDQVANNAGDMQALLNVFSPYLTNPLVILAILVFAAGVAPLIEEAVKPAVLWMMGKHLHSPAQGFVLGILCGAGFALMEGLLAVSGATQMLGFGLAGRAVSSLMHITASGFMGWAIVSSQIDKRYGRLALTYLLSVGIHALWNGSIVMIVYGALRVSTQSTQADLPGMLIIIAGLCILGIEMISMAAALPLINHRLRQVPVASSPLVQSDIIAPLGPSNSRKNNGLDSKDR